MSKLQGSELSISGFRPDLANLANLVCALLVHAMALLRRSEVRGPCCQILATFPLSQR